MIHGNNNLLTIIGKKDYHQVNVVKVFTQYVKVLTDMILKLFSDFGGSKIK